VRETDEEVGAGFADVAAIDGAGSFDGEGAEIKALKGRTNCGDLAFAASGTGTAEDRRLWRDNRRILHKS